MIIISLFEHASTVKQLREMTYITFLLSYLTKYSRWLAGVCLHLSERSIPRGRYTFVLPTAHFLIHHRR